MSDAAEHRSAARRWTLPQTSRRVRYEEGADPRQVAAEWIGDACRETGEQTDALIGIGFALLAIVDEMRASR